MMGFAEAREGQKKNEMREIKDARQGKTNCTKRSQRSKGQKDDLGEGVGVGGGR